MNANPESPLFALLAVQLGYVTAEQVEQAESLARTVPGLSIAEVLVNEGWISPQVRVELERLVDAALAQRSRDSRTPGSSAAVELTQTACFDQSGSSDQQTQDSPSAVPGHLLIETADWKGDSRSRYTLTRVHGKGGLGQVWLALDEHLNRQVALKELHPDGSSSTGQVQRLLREAQITGQLEHPNIVPVYELDRSDTGRPFYTMRFLRGKDLLRHIQRYHEPRNGGPHDRLELRKLLSVFVSVCQAIAYAHARGVVHRDLKPQNVMLGDFGEVMVVDWGLAKLLDQKDVVGEESFLAVGDHASGQETRDGQVKGSPAYMAPEQAQGKIALLDQRTDIYGLGAILFAILTGRPPHGSNPSQGSQKDTLSLVRQIGEAPTPQVRDADPHAPRPLAAVCAKAMAKDRDQRYESASELADDVLNWLADEPVSVYREPWRERLLRWTRRHKTWTQAVAVTLVLVSLAACTAAALIARARSRLAVALAAEQQAVDQKDEALDAQRQATLAEQQAREEATRRFQDARETIDRSLTGISEALQYFPGVEPVRERLLLQAAQDYERFASEQSDDGQLQLEAGRARLRLGDVRRLLGQFVEAEQAYQHAADLFRRLAEREPDNADCRLEQAAADNRLGVLYTAVGPHDQAEDHFLRALEQLDALATVHPSQTTYRHESATVQLNFALLRNQTDQHDAARDLLLQAEQQLVANESNESDESNESNELKATGWPKAARLARVRAELGQQLLMLGKVPEAVEKLQAAIATYGALATQVTDQPEYFERLASARVSLAHAYRRLGRDADVVATYRASIEAFQDLLKARPGVPLYLESLAVARTDLGQMLSLLGKPLEAKEEVAAALRIFIELVASYPEVHRYHEEHAVCTHSFGIVLRDLDDDENAEVAGRDAIRRLGELADAVPEAPGYRVRLATAQSSLGRLLQKHKEYADAELQFRSAIVNFESAKEAGVSDALTSDPLAWCLMHLGDSLYSQGRFEEARPCYKQVRALRETMRDDPEQLHASSLFLATCLDAENRDGPQAVELAEQARRLVADNPRYAHGLGVAHYANQQWDASVQAIGQAVQLRGEADAADHFVLAMAWAKQGDRQQAARYFELGKSAMQIQGPGHLGLLQLRAEAAELIEGQP